MATQRDEFAEYVRTVRQRLGLSQEDLAHAIGVSFATVNRWENGKTMPSKLARRQFDDFCGKQALVGHHHQKGQFG